MLRRFLNLQYIIILESALMGLFWIQAVRFLVGSLYSRLASAQVVTLLTPENVPTNTPGIIQPTVVSGEISFLIYMIALPLILLLFGRIRWMFVIAAVAVAGGRCLMLTGGESFSSTMAASLVLGGGLLYIGMVIRHRAQTLPYLLILAISADQIFRAVGNTLDPSWSPDYANSQLILTFVAVLLCLLTTLRQSQVPPDAGVLTIWGGLGLGALLFLELSLLALPNAASGRAKVDYTTFVPAIIAATLLPVVPFVRNQARNFIALFDGGLRGWSWMLLLALLIVFGTRFQGLFAGGALVIAQFAVSLMWWWLVRPQAEKERNFSGLWLVVSMLIFALLVVFDNFTYDYAYVRDLASELRFLNNIVPPLLRGFRGMGLAVILLSAFLGAIPMIQTTRRIPWQGKGTGFGTLVSLLILIGFSVSAALAARPPVISGVRGVDQIRVGTYNIHGGFSEFFYFSLEDIARTIQQSGANVVLLQEVEAGRLTSFGVDQTLWLARRLGMDRRFFANNEGLYGLAVLSNVEIVFDDGYYLTSATNQTGLQRVQVRPDAGVVNIYNTWLGYLVEGENGTDDSEQQRQLSEIFAILATHYPNGLLSGRTVLGGTFNNTADSPLIERMRATGLTDPFAGRPIEVSATLQRSGRPRARFDYLWLGNLGPISAGTLSTTYSDHRMAVVEVVLTR